jgi:predicted ester cyclase
MRRPFGSGGRRRDRRSEHAREIFAARASPRSRRHQGVHDRFPRAFSDLNFWGAADLITEGDTVVGQGEGGGTHTGPAFSDFLVGSLPAATGRTMRFTGTTVLKVIDGKIAEEVGLDDGVTALTELGLLKAAA